MPSTSTTTSATTTTTSPTRQRSQHRSAARPTQARHRSGSDPFSDPVYAAPYLPYADDQPRTYRSAPSNPPQVPPKPPRKTRQHPDYRDPRMLDAAVRDAVTIRSVDPAPRKMGRSMTRCVACWFSLAASSRLRFYYHPPARKPLARRRPSPALVALTHRTLSPRRLPPWRRPKARRERKAHRTPTS